MATRRSSGWRQGNGIGVGAGILIICSVPLLAGGAAVALARQAPPCALQVVLDSPSDGLQAPPGALVRVRGQVLDGAAGVDTATVLVVIDETFALPADRDGAAGRFYLGWDTTRVPPGPHTLRIVADGPCGQMDAGTRTVYVTREDDPR